MANNENPNGSVNDRNSPDAPDLVLNSDVEYPASSQTERAQNYHDRCSAYLNFTGALLLAVLIVIFLIYGGIWISQGRKGLSQHQIESLKTSLELIKE